MNCSGLDPSSLDSVKVFDYVLFIYWFFGILFLIFCVYPLFKLARERFALYILLFPALLGFFSTILGHVLVINFVQISQNARQTMAMFSLVSNRFHIIALAANRAHAVFLPIHYRNNVTKRIVLIQCVLLHLLSIILAPFNAFFLNFTWTYLIVSSSFYVAIAIRLAVIKAHNRSGNNFQSSDKDIRFTATCFAIQIIAWIYMSQNSAINTKWFIDFINCHPIGQIVYFPLQFILALYPISDEIFLLLICEDMRKLFTRMLYKIFRFNKKTNATETKASNKVVYCTRVPKIYPIQCINPISNPITAQYGNQKQYANTSRIQMLNVSTTPYNRRHIKMVDVSGGISR